jgi:hypothetical protein
MMIDPENIPSDIRLYLEDFQAITEDETVNIGLRVYLEGAIKAILSGCEDYEERIAQAQQMGYRKSSANWDYMGRPADDEV